MTLFFVISPKASSDQFKVQDVIDALGKIHIRSILCHGSIKCADENSGLNWKQMNAKQL